MEKSVAGMFVEDDYGDVKMQKPRKSRWIWLIVLILVLVSLAVVVYFVFMGDSGDGSDEGSERNVLGMDLGEMEVCLSRDGFDLDCNLLFSNSGLEEECEKLGDLRDECLYEVAVRNINEEHCGDIVDGDLRESCEWDIFIGGGEFHEE